MSAQADEVAKPCIQDRFREWLGENFPNLIIVFSGLIAFSFTFHPGLRQEYPSFLPGFVATGLGVLLAASLTLLRSQGREKWAHNKFLRDIYIELNNNSDRLHSHGHILNTDIWNSGISSGSILFIDSKELEELSELYHKIETNIYEAKICRQASMNYNSIPAGPSKDQARKIWNVLSNALRDRESDLKKLIDDFLKKDFWEKAGVNKARGA